jgi:ribonuclease BN (tRNA processing enzyme)
MATELVLLGTVGAPSAYADAGLDFSRLEAVLLTHLHVDHVGDLPGTLLYGWGVRVRDGRDLAPVRVYGPSRPKALPSGDATFHRQTTIDPELPDPGTADLIRHILAGYAYHLNVMPLDASMPDAGALVRAHDIDVPLPAVVFDDGNVRVSAVAVTHGRAVPALAYRFDTPDGSVAFSGDTTVNEDLISLAQGADILVHQVADLDYLKRHGINDAELARAGGAAYRRHPGRKCRRTRAGPRTHPQPLPPGAPGRHQRSGMGGARRARLQRDDYSRA